MTARLETSDLVRATAERYLERGFVEPTGSIIAAREDRERSHEQRHVASSMGRETYHDGRVIERFRADEVAQQLLGDRMALFLEDFQREGDVVGGERATIVELDLGPQQKSIREPVGRYLHRARSEAVQRVGLVLGARHQAREGELHTLRTIALKDEAVERIEGEKVLIEGPGCPDVGEHAALRGAWIDVIEMFEVGWIFEIAEGRNPMALGVMACFDILYEGRYEGSRTEEERFAARLLESIGIEAFAFCQFLCRACRLVALPCTPDLLLFAKHLFCAALVANCLLPGEKRAISAHGSRDAR